MSDKTLTNTTAKQCKDQVSDVEIWGDGDAWKLICKASSEKEGWMKSTKAMRVSGTGCLVQVTTQQRNPDGSWSIAEAVTFAPGAVIQEYNADGSMVFDKEDGPVVRRELV